MSFLRLLQLPKFEEAITPEVAVEILDYCPLPSKVVEILKKAVSEPDPKQQEQAMIAQEGQKAEVRETHGKAAQAETSASLNEAKRILTMADAEVKRVQAMNEAIAGPQMPKEGEQGRPRPGAMFPRQQATDADFEDLLVPEPQSPEVPQLPVLPAASGGRPPSGMELLELLASQGRPN